MSMDIPLRTISYYLKNFTMYVPWTSFLTDMIHSPPTVRLNMTSSSHTPDVETAYEDNYQPKSPTRSFLICISFIISSEKIFLAPTNSSRASF